MKSTSTNINIKNKRASFDYEFVDTYTAGIVLTGTEIKSIRQGKASLVDTINVSLFAICSSLFIRFSVNHNIISVRYDK